MPRKSTMTTEEFITKSKLIHGDKYDYSKTVYTSHSNHVTIICKEHGCFDQRPRNHIIGRGCPSYKHVPRPMSVKMKYDSPLPRDKFIADAIETHGDKYDYSNTELKNIGCMITIRCKKHGNFTVNSSQHLSGRGCSKCILD